MEPVQIDIETATAQELYAECRRLQLVQSGGASPQQLRIKLRLHARRHKEHTFEQGKWAFFADQLGLQFAPDLGTAELTALVCDYLYERLEKGGFVSPDLTGKVLHDEIGDQHFYVTGRLNTQSVAITCRPTCKGEKHAGHLEDLTISYVAGCAFPDVADANEERVTWESDHTQLEG